MIFVSEKGPMILKKGTMISTPDSPFFSYKLKSELTCAAHDDEGLRLPPDVGHSAGRQVPLQGQPVQQRVHKVVRRHRVDLPPQTVQN